MSLKYSRDNIQEAVEKSIVSTLACMSEALRRKGASEADVAQAAVATVKVLTHFVSDVAYQLDLPSSDTCEFADPEPENEDEVEIA